jgi:hypothetical protein
VTGTPHRGPRPAKHSGLDLPTLSCSQFGLRTIRRTYQMSGPSRYPSRPHAPPDVKFLGSGQLKRPMIIAMITVRMVQSTVYEIIGMIAMRNLFMSAVWTVNM